MRRHVNIIRALVTVMALTAVIPPVAAKSNKNKESVEIPVCSKPFGTLAVAVPNDGQNWWADPELKLPPPSTLMELFVMKSRCFDLVDRATGLIGEERAGAAAGELRSGSNVGLEQKIAADYGMVPFLVGQDTNQQGLFQIWDEKTVEGAVVNEVVEQTGNALLGKIPFWKRGKITGFNINKKTADVILSIIDLRSTRIVVMTEGHGEKTDVSFSFEIFRDGDLGVNIGRYAKTPMGKVITMAYLDAYTKMINEFRNLPPSASENSNIKSVRVTKTTILLSDPGGTEKVRNLEVDMLLHPTGRRENLMWEVEDGYGYRGWVSVEDFQWAR